jgi:hypothetical protein
MGKYVIVIAIEGSSFPKFEIIILIQYNKIVPTSLWSSNLSRAVQSMRPWGCSNRKADGELAGTLLFLLGLVISIKSMGIL